jgi:hypothetical protein
MREAALLVAVFTIVVGIVWIVPPEYGTTVRRVYFGTAGVFMAFAFIGAPSRGAHV